MLCVSCVVVCLAVFCSQLGNHSQLALVECGGLSHTAIMMSTMHHGCLQMQRIVNCVLCLCRADARHQGGYYGSTAGGRSRQDCKGNDI